MKPSLKGRSGSGYQEGDLLSHINVTVMLILDKKKKNSSISFHLTKSKTIAGSKDMK